MKKLLSIALCGAMMLSSLAVNSLTASAAVAKPKLTSVKATSSSSITIKWKKVSKVSGYNIYRKTSGKSYSKIATVSASKTSYTSKNLNPSTKYTYALKAYKKSGSKKVYSGYSNAKSATTKAGYKLNKTSVTLKTYYAKTTVCIKGLNKNKYYSNLTWSSSDTSVAYVSGFGSPEATITAYKSGTCVVKAKYAGKTYSCKVYVKMPASRCKITKPSLPKTFSYGYYNSYRNETTIYSQTKITSVKCRFTDRTDGKVTFIADVEGQKLYDSDGDNGSNACGAYYKLLNSSGVIVAKGSIYVSGVKVGEKFLETGEIYISPLEADDYTLVLEDYIY